MNLLFFIAVAVYYERCFEVDIATPTRLTVSS